ncbi:RING-type E3 ubiquitin transferase [Sarracenia purpurea var. burkii]
MGSLANPKPWVPYMNTNDCSQGYCSFYCPQWCYVAFPTPPPIEFSGGNSGQNFSPLVIAIIGILASAFLLVSYYAIISKYCGNNMGSSRGRETRNPNEESEESNNDPSNHEPWHGGATGLDEALIKSITVCKYKKGDGLVEGTDCSVCLGEFQDNESLRLLPKCSHAFHVTCIDTWLKSHSNCPLCRANVVFINASPVRLLYPAIEALPNNESSSSDNASVADDIETGPREEVSQSDAVPKTQLQAPNELENSEKQDAIIEIRDEDDQDIRRSTSMDYLRQSRVSVADVLRLKQDGEEEGLGSSNSKR